MPNGINLTKSARRIRREAEMGNDPVVEIIFLACAGIGLFVIPALIIYGTIVANRNIWARDGKTEFGENPRHKRHKARLQKPE